MTCSGCEAAVKGKLLGVEGITSAEVSNEKGTASLSMDTHVGLATLQAALGGPTGKYQIATPNHSEVAEQARSWGETYKPLLILFGYITAIAAIAAWQTQHTAWMAFRQVFMAGFFLSFSFFKLLDLNGFADSYSMYDVVARRLRGWGFIYPFVELALGIAYATGFNPLVTNAVTLVVMGISLVGVLQSLINKRVIQCACLGAVFNLPMSTVTVVEDALMMAMSAAMLAGMLWSRFYSYQSIPISLR